MENFERILALLAEAKGIARRYYAPTGKPLGITGEVAEYEAARTLGVTLAPARQAGFDATELLGGMTRRLQVKGRCLPHGYTLGQRRGSIQPDKEWDAVLMVLLDSTFSATEIWEADRAVVLAALAAPGSKARNERGALGVAKCKSIGRLRWPLPA
jgi:hypothetical protein